MISTGTGFKVLSRDSIDERFILSKDQMLNIDEAVQPENYFCVCTDDSMLYVYNVNNPVDAETGKFRKVGSNESVDTSIFQKINDDSLMTEDKTIVGAINELENNKLDKPEIEGTAGQILVLQDDGSLAYADNVSDTGKIIDDENIATDKTYSNIKIEERIDEKLFEDKDFNIIDVPESYTRCLDTDTGALKVVADGSLTDAIIEVEISAVIGFIDDIAEGEYVLHTEEVSHIETRPVSIYMPREETYNKQEIDDKIVQASTELENYNLTDWSNFYNGLTVTSNKVDTP